VSREPRARRQPGDAASDNDKIRVAHGGAASRSSRRGHHP
jgi:hypothetical protein